MRFTRTLSLSVAALALTACTQGPLTTPTPTRLEANPLGVHANPVVSDGLTEQTAALQASARGIVRASTVRGAMLGTAVGCGIGILAADGRACLKTAAIGAASGAVAGHLAGRRDVARRVELASPNGLVRNLRKANGSLATIRETLPVLLAQQDEELNRLAVSLATDGISQKDHDRKVTQIRADRAALAESLSLSAAAARRAAANLRDATARGHSGLDWHIAATEQLARDTLSARSTISLL